MAFRKAMGKKAQKAQVRYLRLQASEYQSKGVGHGSPGSSCLFNPPHYIYLPAYWRKMAQLTFFVFVRSGFAAGLLAGFCECLLQGLGFDGSPKDLQTST